MRRRLAKMNIANEEFDVEKGELDGYEHNEKV